MHVYTLPLPNCCRMIDHILREGTFDAPIIAHPLYLKHSGPAALVGMAIVLGAISCRYGQRCWVGAVIVYTVLGWIRVMVKS